MAKKRVYLEDEIQYMDIKSNEIVAKKVRKSYSVKLNDRFVKMHLDCINDLIRLNLTKMEFKILLFLLSNMNYRNDIVINKQLKDSISNSIQCKTSHIDVIISNLKRKELLISANYRGVYKINPLYFGKGSKNHSLELQDEVFMLKNNKLKIKE